MEGCTKSLSRAAGWAATMSRGAERSVAVFEVQTALGSFYFATAVKPELIGHQDAQLRVPKAAAQFVQHLYHVATVTWHGYGA